LDVQGGCKVHNILEEMHASITWNLTDLSSRGFVVLRNSTHVDVKKVRRRIECYACSRLCFVKLWSLFFVLCLARRFVTTLGSLAMVHGWTEAEKVLEDKKSSTDCLAKVGEQESKISCFTKILGHSIG